MALFSGRNERMAYMSGLGAIDQAQAQSLASLGQGYSAARDQYGAASAMYQPYADQGGRALGMYSDSLGLNGAGGNAIATSAFQASPGYQWNVDQATDAVARKQSALGALGSGNTMAAITDRAHNLANQEFGSWQDRLSSLGQLGYAATGAQAGLTKGIGDLYAAEGGAGAGIYSGAANQRAGLYGNLAKVDDMAGTNTWGASLNALKSLGQIAGYAAGAGGGTAGAGGGTASAGGGNGAANYGWPFQDKTVWG